MPTPGRVDVLISSCAPSGARPTSSLLSVKSQPLVGPWRPTAISTVTNTEGYTAKTSSRVEARPLSTIHSVSGVCFRRLNSNGYCVLIVSYAIKLSGRIIMIGASNVSGCRNVLIGGGCGMLAEIVCIGK